MIITVTLNPAMDRTIIVPGFLVGSVNVVETTRTDVGGKGINVSKVIRKLGGESIALGIAGGQNGCEIKKHLNTEEIKHHFVQDKVETRVNIKIIDSLNETYTDINQQGGPYCPDSYDKVGEKLFALVKEEDTVIISGSLPYGADEDIYNKWIRKCKEKGAKVFIDVNGTLLKRVIKEKPYFIKPNNHELEVMSGNKLESMMDYITVSKHIIKDGVKKVVISLGEKGALYVTQDKILYGQGLRVKVNSTVGAGDSMVAAFSFGEEKGLSEEETFRLAIATSAASVMCKGTTAPDYTDIKKLMDMVTYERL